MARNVSRPKKTAKTPEQTHRKMYSLRLYITGQTPRSANSLQNLRNICKQYLSGRFELEVIDIYQQPDLAREAQIVAAPTLVKRLPLPLRKLVGDLSDKQQVLLGLDIQNDAADDLTNDPTGAEIDAKDTNSR